MQDIRRPPANTEEVSIAGFGVSGCVFTIRGIPNDNDPVAVKVQMGPISTSIADMKRVATIEQEARVLAQLDTILQRKFAPALLQTKDGSNAKRYMNLLRSHLLKCRTIRNTIQQYGVENLKFSFQLLEYADGGVLGSTRVPSGLVKQNAFQIAWTLAVCQHELEFRHLDLSTRNVIFQTLKGEGALHRFVRGDTTWHIRHERGALLPKIIDFGISRTATVPKTQLFEEGYAGLDRILSPTVFFVDMMIQIANTAYASDKDREYGRDQLRRGYHSDMWAFGVMLFKIALSGWEAFDNGTSLWTIGIDKREKSLLSIRNNLVQLFLDMSLTVSTSNKYAAFYVDNLPGICLLNEALGNGLLPTDTNIPGIKNSDIHKIFTAHMRTVGRLPDKSSVYTKLVDYVRTTHGPDIIDLVRRLLAWGVDERVTLGEGKRAEGLFMDLVIQHPYFEELRAEPKDSSSSADTWTHPRPGHRIAQLPFREFIDRRRVSERVSSASSVFTVSLDPTEIGYTTLL